MRQLFVLAVAFLGLVWSQPCYYQPTKWMSPLNLEGPRYEPSFKPLHVFSFLDGGEGLVLENTGDTVWITYPIRPDIPSTPANLTDIQISKGPLADHYTADHLEFRWGPAVLPVAPTAPSSSTGVAGPADNSSAPSNSTFLEASQTVHAKVEWGSDHAISGRYFPLEMQVYFYNTKHKSYADALAASPQEPDYRDINEDVVALSVLFDVGAQNEELTKITDRLELVQTNGSTTPIVAKMCFEKILGKVRDYITYPGSITRAPCTKGVRWIVLVEALTVSQAQLDQFRLLTLDNPVWTPPLQHRYEHRLVQTNLKELPLDDKFIPAFHPHGPPLNVIDPAVGGTIINPFALNAEDAAYKNYWTPFDYTIVDDAEPATEEASTASEAPADSTGAAETVDATGDAETAEAPTGETVLVTAFLLEQTGVTAPTPTAATGGTTGGSETLLPAPTAETGVAVTSSTGNAPQTNDHKVKIPHFFTLNNGGSSVDYFTPDILPHKHDHSEDNHYHPPSADVDELPEDDSFKGKKGRGQLNPARAPAKKAMPQLKEQKKSQKVTKVEVAKAAAAAKKPVDPKAAFLNGKRANKK